MSVRAAAFFLCSFSVEVANPGFQNSDGVARGMAALHHLVSEAVLLCSAVEEEPLAVAWAFTGETWSLVTAGAEAGGSEGTVHCHRHPEQHVEVHQKNADGKMRGERQSLPFPQGRIVCIYGCLSNLVTQTCGGGDPQPLREVSTRLLLPRALESFP